MDGSGNGLASASAVTRRAALVQVFVAALLCAGVASQGGCGVRPHPYKPTPSAMRRVLWHDPGKISSLDLSWRDRRDLKRPVPPFRFVKEDFSGSHAKVRVKDVNGISWNVKLEGDAHDTAEVHAEIAAQRIVWALGYFVEPGFYVPGGTIDGVHDLKRAARGLTAAGVFRGARFKERPREATGEQWTVFDNPFVGTRELSGLMILMTMINNWDMRPANTAVMPAEGKDGATELHYIVSDLGASFGRMQDVRFPQRIFSMLPWVNWSVRDYQEQRFIDGVHDSRLHLHFRGLSSMPEVPLDHARWFADLVSQLTPRQIRQALEAAAATPEEVDGFSTRFLSKARELRTAVSESTEPN